MHLAREQLHRQYGAAIAERLTETLPAEIVAGRDAVLTTRLPS
jgi:hypothetical protein